MYEQNIKWQVGIQYFQKEFHDCKSIGSIFEPTCASCTVGSYASLSVCLSVVEMQN